MKLIRVVRTIRRIVSILYSSGYCFVIPKKTKTLIYKRNGSDDIKCFFDENDVSIMETIDESINLTVLIRSVISLKGYYYEYVATVKPSLLITFIDNSMEFIEMKVPSGTVKMTIQNGFRSAFLDIFSDLHQGGMKRGYVDYMCMFGESVSEEMSRYVYGNTCVIGSIRNNKKKVADVKKQEVIYISTFRESYLSPNVDMIKGVTWGEYIKNGADLFLWLAHYCECNGLRLNVLGAYAGDQDVEYGYYKRLVGSGAFEFIARVPDRDTYRIVDEYEVIVSIDSTLGYEALSRGSKVAMFGGIRGDFYPISTRKYGWPEKLKSRGLFWTGSKDHDEWRRVLDYVVNTTKEVWDEECKKFIEKIIIYDNGNVKLISLLNELNVSLNSKYMPGLN